MKNLKTYIISIIAIVMVLSVVAIVNKAQANSSYFTIPAQTAVATTSVDYMRVTNSVLVLDAYNNAIKSLDSATLLIQSIASSSDAVQTVTIQYSHNGIDWFNDQLSTTTSASIIALNNSQRSYTITGNTTASTTRVAINVPTPVRYVRATVATSTALSSVWMQFVPKREVTE